jgi:hypothetical protein
MLGSGRTKVVAVADPEEDTMAEDFNLSTQSIRRYPMMVMSLHKVLSLTRLEQHQVYKERGDLVEYKDGMQVIFASHEWVSRAHPDPDMVSSAELIRHRTTNPDPHSCPPLLHALSETKQKRQFKVLQHVFGPAGLVAGNPAVVGPEWGDALTSAGHPPIKTKERKKLLKDPTKVYIWYDYFSVPQRSTTDADWANDQSAAISCIPTYVDNSMIFAVLAPPLDHLTKRNTTVEMATWKKRGWCRMERVAKLLCSNRNKGASIMILSEKLQFFVPTYQKMQPIGEGDFG